MKGAPKGRSRKKGRESERRRFEEDLSRDWPSFSYPRGFRRWQMPFGRGARRLLRIALLVQLGLIWLVGLVLVISRALD